MRKTPWTEDQLRGITTVGRSLLVSAAAGSGKTAVLSERCAYLVCDAPNPCNVDELLVVTFTEAAAVEMKRRIEGALRDRAARAPSPRLARQAALVEKANVSTLHSFCMRLLRQHFHLAGLDPSFRVLDADEAYLLRRETGRQLLRDHYELDPEGRFQRLVDAFGDGDDTRILRQLLHAHELLTSVVDPKGWLDRSRSRIVEAAEGTLEESELGRELHAMIAQGLDALRSRCDDAKKQVARLRFPKYALYVAELAGILNYWSEALHDGGIDALNEVVKDVQWTNLPRESGDAADREVAKSAIDAVREGMKAGPWRDILRFSVRQWQEGLKAMLPHADMFLLLVDRFQARYTAAKVSARAIDFSDLERHALNVLRDVDGDSLTPSPAARAFHRRFAHVLVDEYQDINEVQDAILHLVSRECVAGNGKVVPNLFCVGDVKQSIYRFRLAEPARFLARQDSFREETSHGQVIDLQHNFRSRAPLLDAINSVFDRLMTAEAAEITYDQTHRLRAGLSYPPAEGVCCFTGSPIELHLLPKTMGEANDDEDACEADELERSEREAMLIARRVRTIMGLDGASPTCVMQPGKVGLEPRPARFSDIVILLRSMKHKAGQFASILRGQGIPVHADSGSGYFESVEVRDMLALLEVLDNQRQDIPLAALLRSPIANLPQPEEAMARVRIAFPAGEEALPFHEAVIRYARERDDELAGRLRAVLAQLDLWRTAARRRPVAEVIWQIYRQSGYLAFVAGLANGEQRVANLMHLHERAAQFGQFQRQGLSRFMRLLRELDEESDLGLPSVASEAEDVVRIMSVHRSKGLEFPVVILPDLGKAMNLSDCHGHILMDRAAGLGMSVVDYHKRCRYPSLALTLVQERLRRQTLAEELRVLYVAMTRAKEHLILVGTCEEKHIAKWATRWTGHNGPLPADEVLGARSMLDWLGPVASATIDTFSTLTYTADDVRSWEINPARSSQAGPQQEAMARLEPLAPAPPVPQSADQAIARVSFAYPHRAFAKVPAAQTVTGRKKFLDAPAALPTHASAEQSSQADDATGLPRPRFMPEGGVVTATDRGSATHLVLQHLNFTAGNDTTDIALQIDRLVSRHVLTAAQAVLVDRDALAWLMQTPLGRLLRDNSRILRRELSLYFPDKGDTAAYSGANQPSSLDQVMVRGRVDVLIPLVEGAIIVDYKTDDVPSHFIAARTELYRSQVEAYREAVERITGCVIAKTFIVFLTARQIVEM